jgi:hypothetical protein
LGNPLNEKQKVWDQHASHNRYSEKLATISYAAKIHTARSRLTTLVSGAPPLTHAMKQRGYRRVH